MFDGGDYTLKMEDPFPSMTHQVTTTPTKKKNKNNNKRRFSDEQIKSLETIFEFESRLEPRKKMQVAKDLGLHPRQVAIWFQNRRARRKSKQLERDYTILQSNYNNLASKLEALKKEKQALASQLQKLKEEGQCCGQVNTRNNNIDGDSDNGEAAVRSDCEEQQLSYSMERSEHGVGVQSDDDSGIIMTSYFRVEKEPDLISMVEHGDSALTSPENWHNFDSDALFDDHSNSGYQWWDFWS